MLFNIITIIFFIAIVVRKVGDTLAVEKVSSSIDRFSVRLLADELKHQTNQSTTEMKTKYKIYI